MLPYHCLQVRLLLLPTFSLSSIYLLLHVLSPRSLHSRYLLHPRPSSLPQHLISPLRTPISLPPIIPPLPPTGPLRLSGVPHPCLHRTLQRIASFPAHPLAPLPPVIWVNLTLATQPPLRTPFRPPASLLHSLPMRYQYRTLNRSLHPRLAR